MAKHTICVKATVIISKEFEVEDEGRPLSDLVQDITYEFAHDCGLESYLIGQCEEFGCEWYHDFLVSEKVVTTTYEPINE